ncbi:hypothetical protein J4Q44_G00214080 [Coregonus suidteri]|uniref:Uncharacterized protein n=1 Tax=Coregonus suidteri TaxID=861788 RepID=A0AAN8R0A3_9TELE
MTIVDVSLLPSITQHQMSSTLVKVNTDKRSAKDRAKKGRRTRRHSALRQLGNSVESWIEKELLRHEYLQKVQRERTQRAHESRGDLELQRLQQWVNQAHHTRCWSAHPGGYKRHIFDALGSRQCEQGRYLRTCPTIQLHNGGTPPSHLPPPSHAASPPLVSPCHPTAKTLHQAWDSKEDQPYRLPMSHFSLSRTMEHKPVTREDLWEVDRKAGILLLQRPNSGNSIPSKGTLHHGQGPPYTCQASQLTT